MREEGGYMNVSNAASRTRKGVRARTALGDAPSSHWAEKGPDPAVNTKAPSQRRSAAHPLFVPVNICTNNTY